MKKEFVNRIIERYLNRAIGLTNAEITGLAEITVKLGGKRMLNENYLSKAAVKNRRDKFRFSERKFRKEV